MAVNLTELSLPQLEGLKTQLDQETEFLSSSIGQLKVVQTKYVEAKDSLNVLNKSNEGKELLVPLTSSMYVPGKLNDVDHVLVDVGTGYFVEKVSHDFAICIHLFLPIRVCMAICKFYGSGFWSLRIQVFLGLQNSFFCCLILQIGVSYHIFNVILIMSTLVCSANSFTFTHVVI
ncbi:prefoldin subunit 5 [Garra rufa]|uniref:prefoldin subunit 5 n=1 Tax=Garra rufa TaxID=137080 RepID=UPI003CCE7200